METTRVILCIGTLDSKGPELKYVKNLINSKRDYQALVMDVGCLEEAYFDADVTAGEVARAAGTTIEEVRAIAEAGPATRIMTEGARKVVRELYASDRFSGVLAIGGGTGSGIAAAVLQDLPIGFPKFMLSSQKIVQAGIRKYVGTKDIVILPSIADIAGLNRLTIDSLQKAVGAITGIMDTISPENFDNPLVFMTMTGLSTGCGLAVKSRLEREGFEVGVFHTIGVGGETFEELVRSYPVKGVIELGLNEIGNELFGGLASAGPGRLEAAGEAGIPQIITPGCIDILNFLGPETLPEKYAGRAICYHNPQATLPRVSADEQRQIAMTMSEKLNRSKGRVKFLVPLRGFSSIDCEGNDFYDPGANTAFIETLQDSLRDDIEIVKIDANINAPEFSETVVNEFLRIL